MSGHGWIALHRDIQKHWIWDDAAKFKAWVDMLLAANHEQRTFNLGQALITVERGSFITSVARLATKWRWSRHRVSDFLRLLKSSAMIDFESDTRKTRITIINYGKYQDVIDPRETAMKSKRTAKGQQKDSCGTQTTIKQLNKGSQIDPILGLDPQMIPDPCLPPAVQWARVTVDGERFENLRLTKDQLARLVEKNGKPCIEFYLRRAAGFAEAAKKKFNSRDGHYRTLCSWIAKDRAERRGFYAQGVVEPKRIPQAELDRLNRKLAS